MIKVWRVFRVHIHTLWMLTLNWLPHGSSTPQQYYAGTFWSSQSSWVQMAPSTLKVLEGPPSPSSAYTYVDHFKVIIFWFPNCYWASLSSGLVPFVNRDNKVIITLFFSWYVFLMTDTVNYCLFFVRYSTSCWCYSRHSIQVHVRGQKIILNIF